MAELKLIADIIFGIVVGVIALGGGTFGIYSLYEGFTADQPDAKKRGISVILVVVLVLVAAFQLKPLLYSLANIS